MSKATQSKPRREKKQEQPKARKAPRVKSNIKSGGDVIDSDRFSAFRHS